MADKSFAEFRDMAGKAGDEVKDIPAAIRQRAEGSDLQPGQRRAMLAQADVVETLLKARLDMLSLGLAPDNVLRHMASTTTAALATSVSLFSPSPAALPVFLDQVMVSAILPKWAAFVAMCEAANAPAKPANDLH